MERWYRSSSKRTKKKSGKRGKKEDYSSRNENRRNHHSTALDQWIRKADRNKSKKGYILYGKSGIGKRRRVEELCKKRSIKLIPTDTFFLEKDWKGLLSQVTQNSRVGENSKIQKLVFITNIDDLDDQCRGDVQACVTEVVKRSKIGIIITSRTKPFGTIIRVCHSEQMYAPSVRTIESILRASVKEDNQTTRRGLIREHARRANGDVNFALSSFRFMNVSKKGGQQCGSGKTIIDENVFETTQRLFQWKDRYNTGEKLTVDTAIQDAFNGDRRLPEFFFENYADHTGGDLDAIVRCSESFSEGDTYDRKLAETRDFSALPTYSNFHKIVLPASIIQKKRIIGKRLRYPEMLRKIRKRNAIKKGLTSMSLRVSHGIPFYGDEQMNRMVLNRLLDAMLETPSRFPKACLGLFTSEKEITTLCNHHDRLKKKLKRVSRKTKTILKKMYLAYTVKKGKRRRKKKKRKKGRQRKLAHKRKRVESEDQKEAIRKSRRKRRKRRKMVFIPE
ncbi:MAG: hypothetical protein ACTSUE_09615 [Promethearchaeota archaeon]